MTVTATASRISYVGDGATTDFSITFGFQDPSDIVVYKVVTATGVAALQVEGTDYEIEDTDLEPGDVTDEEDYTGGGYVLMDTAPAATDTLLILRAPAQTQGTTISKSGPFPSSALETALDKLTMLVQRAMQLLGRSVKLPDEYIGSFDPELPDPTDRESQALVVNDAGTGFAFAAVEGMTSQLPAAQVGNGVVSDTEFDYLNGVTSAIQTQLDAKQAGPLTGDVTTSGAAATIADDAVTNAKAANMATQTIKGRTTAGTGDPEDLTATQATAILNAFVGDSGAGGTKGLVPAPVSGDATKFLRGDGTWVTNAALTDGDKGDITVSASGATWTIDNKLTQAAAQASTSGTSIDFTGIPAWVKRITVMFNGVSQDGSHATNSNLMIQLGVSGTPETTGYVGAAMALLSGSGAAGVANTTGLQVTASSNSAGFTYSGNIILSTLGSNIWTSSGVLGHNASARMEWSGGAKTLAGTLDMIRITTVGGTAAFDAGSINILYE